MARGISNQTRSVNQLTFHEKDAAQNGLFVAHLESVSVETSNNAENKDFSGLDVPRLVFHFASNHANTTEVRHAYLSLFPVPSNVNTIENGTEAWRVNSVFAWIKHILDVFYLRTRAFTAEEEKALILAVDDTDENGDYVAVDPETVLAAYKTLFENVASMMNGTFKKLAEGETAKPCYKNENGKPLPCWIKLLRHRKQNNRWRNVTPNGDLGFDSFVGSGAVELVKKDAGPAILRIDPVKESITPKETKVAPTVGAAGNPMGMGGVVPPMGMGGTDGGAYSAAGEEMPF